MISSTSNPKIKWVRSLQGQRRTRQKERLFVVEGVRLVEEALASGWSAKLLLYTQDLHERGQQIVDSYRRQAVSIETVSEHVMRAASDTETPQGILAVLSQKELPTPERLDFVLVADGVRDPGNLGTILRSAAAAGVQTVLLPPGSVDPFAPKVVRAGMGAHFHLPTQPCSWQQITTKIEGLCTYLAVAGAGIPYDQADFTAPLALVIGSEAQGISTKAQQLSTAQVHIPMPGGGESLNAAVAASVLLFEVVRQRQQQNKLGLPAIT